MSKWRTWRALSWSERRLLVQAGMLLVYARVKLPFIDFRADPGAAGALGARAATEPSLPRAEAIAHLVRIASAHCPVAITCLHRSLVLWWLLRREGIPCELRLGADTEPGPFGAHAWVQCAAVALNEEPRNLARFKPFAAAVIPVGRRLPWRLATRRVS